MILSYQHFNAKRGEPLVACIRIRLLDKQSLLRMGKKNKFQSTIYGLVSARDNSLTHYTPSNSYSNYIMIMMYTRKKQVRKAKKIP